MKYYSKNHIKLLAISSAILLSACEQKVETFMLGTLERERIEISAESNEPIIAIYVNDSQMLSAGELILEQDPTRLQYMLAEQSALRDQTAARLAELERGPRVEIIREARAQLESAQAYALNAATNLKRAQEVFARELSNQSTLDLAKTQAKTAAASKQAASESLERLLNGTTSEELMQAAAALTATEARVNQIKLNLERLKIYAPVSGIIDKRLYQIGERPKPGATVAVILDTTNTYARIYVPESMRAAVLPGKQLEVNIDGYNRLFKGTVRWVSADATFTPYFALTEHDRSRLSYLAEIEIQQAADLPSGLPLSVDFPAQSLPGN